MPDTPDRKIEGLLRAYAAKRREELGAPVELHPAPRRLLHAEVARLRGRPAARPASWWSSLAVFWPRLAWAVGVVAAVGVCLWLLVPRGGPGLKTARNDTPEQLPKAAKSLEEREGPQPVTRSSEYAVAQRLEADVKAQPLNLPEPATSAVAVPAIQPPSADRSTAGRTELARAAVAADKAEQSGLLKEARPAAPASAPKVSLDWSDRDNATFRSFIEARTESATSRADLAGTSRANSSIGPIAPSTLSDAAGKPLMRTLAESSIERTELKLKAAAPTQAFYGLAYSTLAREAGGRAGQEPSEAMSERLSVDTLGVKDAGLPDVKARAPAGLSSSSPAVVAARPEPSPRLARPTSGGGAQGNLAVGVRYRFVQSPAPVEVQAKARTVRPMNALSFFDFERTGDQVLIVDADGSVYEGPVLNERGVTRQDAADAYSRKKDGQLNERGGTSDGGETGKAERRGTQALMFRATGTNRTLRQAVVVQGVLRAFGDGSALDDVARTRGPAATALPSGPVVSQNVARRVSAGSARSELQLEGRLRIGTNESDFKAVRLAPQER